jgi:beta-phosphoglucomutase-like phosphatase (HAD superfamily)
MPDPAFDVTVAGDEVAEGKPHPEPYLQAARRLGVPVVDCIVIEDSPTGVASGQASGAFVLAVPHLVEIPAHPRRRVVASLDGVTLADLLSGDLPPAVKALVDDPDAWRSGADR